VTYPLINAALLALVTSWAPTWACACAFRLNTVKVQETYPGGVQGYRLQKLPSDPTFKDSVFRVPCIAYLSALLAAAVTPSREIITEHTADSGLLMMATEERLDPENPEYPRRAHFIVEIMLARTGYPTYTDQRG
jgi:hypothetical protein